MVSCVIIFRFLLHFQFFNVPIPKVFFCFSRVCPFTKHPNRVALNRKKSQAPPQAPPNPRSKRAKRAERAFRARSASRGGGPLRAGQPPLLGSAGEAQRPEPRGLGAAVLGGDFWAETGGKGCRGNIQTYIYIDIYICICI